MQYYLLNLLIFLYNPSNYDRYNPKHMPAMKRQRGATAIQSNRSQLPQLRLPRVNLPSRHLLTLATAGLVTVFAVFIMPSNTDRDDAVDSPASAATEPLSSATTASVVEAPVDIFEQANPPVEPAVTEQPWIQQKVQSGDNLSLIFKRAGFDQRDVHDVISQAPEGKSLGRIFPGQTIAFQADEQGALAAVRHVKSPLETITYRRGEAGFETEKETQTPDTRQETAAGEIRSSLFLAGQQAGLSQNVIMEMANVFGGVIDFVQDPRKGDSFQVIYDKLYLSGEAYKDGDIVAASYSNQGQTFNAYRYTDSKGDTGYYNQDGVSMRKAFLLAPVDFTRISSNFNPRRLHPIYKTRRPHRGTDYAAATGTPVFAAGDGRVVKAGYSKANGNYVFIQHGEQYMTRYLHLHKRKVKQGQRVSQSQVIGTVGSTGAATGPHLHYEFLMNGVHRNPRTIHKKLPKAKSLPAAEMPMFRQAIAETSMQLAALQPRNQLSMVSGISAPSSSH